MDPPVKLLHFFRGKGVGQAQQGRNVLYFRKTVFHPSPYLLGGRIRGHQFRVLGFQFPELAHHTVVLCVRNGGHVLHII